MSQNKAFSTPFILAVLCIYFSYFLHGISVITLAQNMSSLAEKFSTDNAGIAYLISGIGLGRLISILFFGVISDKFGRRAVILMAVIMYLLFFFGIPACPNLTLAYGLAVCVGIANSALDTGGYPALMECFPKASGSAVILVKAMVSFGQMFYPMLVSYMLLNNIWYGYGLIIPGILFVLITLMLLKSKFPSQLVDAFVIGFSAAGGILQLGVSVMSEFFPKSKAKVTSIYMMMGGLANFVIPLITGYLSNIGLQYIIVLDFTFALLALITAIIVFIRYYRVFIIPENDVRFGERKFSTRLNTIKHRG
ncbi:MFS transporter [Escherichia coli]|nr:MFS transporter [Escherichia coli]EGM9492994.1 MFS transporter [Escherichia coli]